MTPEEANNTDKAVQHIFRGQNYRPYRMPIYKVIPGPADMAKLDEYMETYRKEENWEDAILPYADEETGLILYMKEILSINNIHINLGE